MKKDAENRRRDREPAVARRVTRRVFYGTVGVGGDSPVSIQSMSTFPAAAVEEAGAEIRALSQAGCEIVRVAVRDDQDVMALERICSASPIPVIADIHFDHRLAVSAAGRGVAGLRINPGNIGGEKKVMEVVEAAARAGITLRVGVNAGSLEKELRSLYEKDQPRALCESANRQLGIIERSGFRDLVFSLKSSSAAVTVEANRLFAAGNDYPLHLGVTEAGPPLSGTARSVVALTQLLGAGIGDTIRVSLSGDPVREIIVAAAVLSSLGLRDDFPRVISCPTCGRCHLEVAGMAEKLERILPGRAGKMTVAVMGCEVNGPGEAREADIGIAGAKQGAVIFRNGRIVKKIEKDFFENLISEIDKFSLEEDPE
ncbi:MAG: flavodoxin-dependent (E)-4-hydroxy-3-methylbut-2-enyl-diphosphate synthase [Candidatus Krumholzibacteriota bacterium]|nr:flavodoxin-dependent (E)-4-hydroxy-3-methylbut-2-enyl-diphosphate synthase [Candidatus Krumholzibacteriota bacterium]